MGKTVPGQDRKGSGRAITYAMALSFIRVWNRLWKVQVARI